MSSPYGAFAKHYDEIMGTVNYFAWSRYILQLIRRFHSNTLSILDTACGTGTMCFLLEEKCSCQIDGFDISPHMLREAREKQKENHSDVNFFQADLRTFTVDQPYDVLLCLQDSINYLMTEEELMSSFLAANKALRVGGVYIIDITTRYNLEHNFSFQVIEIPTGNGKVIWRNRYDHTRDISIVDLKVHDYWNGTITRECHKQKIFALEKIKNLLSACGFADPHDFHGFTFSPPTNMSEHIHIVSRKIV